MVPSWFQQCYCTAGFQEITAEFQRGHIWVPVGLEQVYGMIDPAGLQQGYSRLRAVF
jgi:hypothetical protein